MWTHRRSSYTERGRQFHVPKLTRHKDARYSFNHPYKGCLTASSSNPRAGSEVAATVPALVSARFLTMFAA